MSTLANILNFLDEFDGIGHYFELVHSRIKETRGGVSILFEGHTHGFPTGTNMSFEMEVEEGDMMPPDEIVARVMNRDNPDYNFATDPYYHEEDAAYA